MNRLVITAILFMIVSPIYAASLHVRVEPPPADMFWCGQRVTLRLYVLSDTDLRSNPRLGKLTMPGAVIVPGPGSPTYHSEQREGKAFNGRVLDIECFPHRPGKLTLEPISIVQRTENGDLRATTQALTITTRQPPGTEGMGLVPATTTLKVKQTWSSHSNEAMVGDSLERNVSWHAENVMGMALPTLPLSQESGMRVYTGKSLPLDKINRGQLIGGRKDHITHVFEQPGVYELPKIRIPWFDLSTETLKFEELPGHTITIKPSTAVSEQAIQTNPQEESKLLWLIIGTGLLLTISIIVLKRGGKGPNNITTDSTRKAELEKALSGDDAHLVHRRLLAWLQALPEHRRQQAWQHLEPEITNLSRYRFGKGPKPEFHDLKRRLDIAEPQAKPLPLPALNAWKKGAIQ